MRDLLDFFNNYQDNFENQVHSAVGPINFVNKNLIVIQLDRHPQLLGVLVQDGLI